MSRQVIPIYTFEFQPHPAYSAQINHLARLPGFKPVFALAQRGIEHARWQTRAQTRWRVRTFPWRARWFRLTDGIRYISGTFPAAAHPIVDAGARIHVDADDALSILGGGRRGYLPEGASRRQALRLAKAMERGNLSISFWSEIQLANFLATLRFSESMPLLHSGRLSVLPPAISPAPLRLLPIGSEQKLRILAIATGKFWSKGIPDGIAACAEAIEAGADLQITLIGGGVPQSWQPYIKSSPWIRELGHIAREEIEAEFAKSDLLLFPSHQDTYGWAVLEAKRHGVPAIATHFYSRPEIVAHNVDGLLVREPFGNPFRPASPVQYSEAHLGFDESGRIMLGAAVAPHIQELSLSILQLWRDRNLLRKLGENARAATLDGGRFSVAARLSKLQRILHD